MPRTTTSTAVLLLALYGSAPGPGSAPGLEPKFAPSQQITVAAAADLTFVFKDVAARFEKATGIAVQLSFGSSGNFFAEIQNGAPYDVFFSADVRYPQQLERAGLIEPGTLTPYARGKIVLWTPKSSSLDVNRGLGALVDPGVHKIAIANPEHAPYGRAAVSALQHDGLYDKVRDKLVLGENISQTAQFVLSGNAEVGIVALSLALSPTMKDQGRYFEIPESSYPPINQAAVILKSSHNKGAARRLLDFMHRPEIAALMRSYGFAPPPASPGGEDTAATAPRRAP